MSLPKLTFFCELEADALQELFADPAVTDHLRSLQASVSLGILDYSPVRAAVVRRLNHLGIPVIAWLLLPKEQGYWFNAGNYAEAQACYQKFLAWTVANQLIWERIGLDIEPDIREVETLTKTWWKIAPRWLGRIFNMRRVKIAQQAYQLLIEQIRRDGYPVDTYQFPLLADERKVKTSALQRVTGVIDLPADREVWMLYTSLVRPHGPGMLSSYGSEAQSIGLGSTGGGVEVAVAISPLSWSELERDLRLAYNWCNDLHLYSLEGCVHQGFLEQIKNLIWDQPLLLPEASIHRVDRWRKTLQSFLWVLDRLYLVGLGLSGLLAVILGIHRLVRRRSKK